MGGRCRKVLARQVGDKPGGILSGEYESPVEKLCESSAALSFDVSVDAWQNDLGVFHTMLVNSENVSQARGDAPQMCRSTPASNTYTHI